MKEVQILASDVRSEQSDFKLNMVFSFYKKVCVVLGIVIMFNTDSFEGKRNRHRHGDDETEGIVI